MNFIAQKTWKKTEELYEKQAISQFKAKLNSNLNNVHKNFSNKLNSFQKKNSKDQLFFTPQQNNQNFVSDNNLKSFGILSKNTQHQSKLYQNLTEFTKNDTKPNIFNQYKNKNKISYSSAALLVSQQNKLVKNFQSKFHNFTQSQIKNIAQSQQILQSVKQIFSKDAVKMLNSYLLIQQIFQSNLHSQIFTKNYNFVEAASLNYTQGQGQDHMSKQHHHKPHSIKIQQQQNDSVILGPPLFSLPVFTVPEQTAWIIQRLGKFHDIKFPGLNFKIPFFDSVVNTISLKVQQLDIMLETKTKDDAMITLQLAVQYKVIPDKIQEAFYSLDKPHDQIISYVMNVLHSEVPKLILDDVFIKKEQVALAVKQQLSQVMQTYGYDILNTLVVNIQPDVHVKEAMNKINAAQRERIAAQYQGEAQKILIVEKAKAEAEKKRLQGKGIADQRKEIANGLREQVETLNQVGINAQEASALIVVTQHYDAMQTIGEHSNSNLILLPNSPTQSMDMLSNMTAAFTAAHQASQVGVSNSHSDQNKVLQEKLNKAIEREKNLIKQLNENQKKEEENKENHDN